MCNSTLVHCWCCNDFLYLSSFKHCNWEDCVNTQCKISPISYCDICEANFCRRKKEKCVAKELKLEFRRLKSSEFFNFTR